MAFVKLDCGILDSTLWVERSQRDVFITSLLMAEPFELCEPAPQIKIGSNDPTGFVVPPGWYGIVHAAGPGIVARALMNRDEGMIGLRELGEPDPDSRSSEHEGRRLVRISGGFIVLNYFKYRDRDYSSADRSKRYRERQRMKGVNPVNKGDANKANDTRGASQPTRDTMTKSRDITHAEAEAEGYKQERISVPTEPHPRKARALAISDDVRQVFDCWKQTFGHTRAVLDAKRAKLIADRLRDYSADVLCESLAGYLQSGHHMGANDTGTRYDAIDLLLRDAKHVDMGLGFQRAPANKPRIRDSANDVQPDLSNEAWRRQMAALGVDPDQLPQHQPNREHQP